MDGLPWLLLNEILFRLDRRDMTMMRCTNRYFRRHMSEDPYFEKEYKSFLLPIPNQNVSSGDFMLLGCCSGLLLVFLEKLFVVNPITRKYRLVNYTWSSLFAKMFSGGEIIDPEKRVGIGFTVDEVDPNTLRFKIVCLIEEKEEEAKTMYQFEVSLGDSYWVLPKTTITCHSSELVKGMRPIYLDQVLYWLRNDGSIVAFNTVTEEAHLLQAEFPNSKALFCSAPGLTLLAATEEVICVYALENSTKWVLIRLIPNKVALDQKKRMMSSMSWKVAAYDGKFLVLTEATKDAMVFHEYDLRANKWTIIQGLSNSNNEDVFQFRPSSFAVIGLNNLIGEQNLLFQVQPQTSTLIKRLSSCLKHMNIPSLKMRSFCVYEWEGNVGYVKRAKSRVG
ncbi:PREDICTED: putative F-box protein At1g20795 [Camelina sativa]|uniref:F-box protein At1g20795 n=1 Tax=Camelina sativa TaxID=90675 RepID=A0ABM0X031_CAMSA|nr:PREDICTED: putative F-box protein At1g20795 [Camelina sativa]